MKKILTVLFLMMLVLPINIKGEEQEKPFDMTIDCGEELELKPGKKLTCTVDVSVYGGAEFVGTQFNLKVDDGEGLTLSNPSITDKANEIFRFTGTESTVDGKEYLVSLTAGNQTEKLPIIEFEVTADNIEEGKSVNISITVIEVDILKNGSQSEYGDYVVEPLTIRIPSTVNSLSSLKIDDEEQLTDENKNKEELVITKEVDSSTTSITFSTTATDGKSEVTGVKEVEELDYGENTFDIVVTSESGDERTYKVVVVRPEVRELEELSIDKDKIELKSGTYEYSYKVKNDVTSVELLAKIKNEDVVSFVEGFGSRTIKDLKVGKNEILIKTKDANDEELTYKIIINRLDEDGKDTTIEENPKTGTVTVYGVFMLLGLLALVAYILIRKYSKFPKKV